MRCDVDPVAGAERHHLAVREAQPCGTREHQHEFRLVLIVPETFGTGLAARHDALDAHNVTTSQPLDDLAGIGGGEVAQQVHVVVPWRLAVSVAATARFQPA
jgi:hypothetical protein